MAIQAQPFAASTATPTHLSTTSAPVSAVQVRTAESATGTSLTAAQVCDLPMDELLARVNGGLDTTDIDEAKFLGYVTITRSGRITIYTPASLAEDTRDAATRFLITQHLGLPTHLFPDGFQVTRFEIAGSEVQA